MVITYTTAALKDLKSIGHVAAAKVTDKIKAYAENPRALANQVKKLKGVDAMRLRVGDYRVIFTEQGMVLHVLRIGHRREIYD
jgi:mRNA interferase RelE/StbE